MLENVYVLTDVLHILKIIFLCDLVFELRKRSQKTILVIGIIMMSILGLLWSYNNNDAFVFISYVIALCIFICMIYDGKKIELIFCSLWIVFLTSMLDLFFTESINIVFRLFSQSDERLEGLVASAFSLIFILIVVKIYKSKYNVPILKIGFVKLFLFTILATADAFVVSIITAVLIKEYTGNHKLVYFLAVLIAIIGILIQLASVILLIISRDTYKEKEEITQKYLNEQTKHYQYLEQREINTKKFRHDIKNHMQVLSMMAKNNQYSDFNEYMKEINMQIDRLGNVITVNNGIVDAIVNKYHSEAVQKGINITFKGMLPSACRISPYDLCTIFSNLLSNAIEAAEKSDEKRITLECRYTGDNIIIIAENTFKDEGQFSHSKIVTTKKDVEYHGFGIENIKDAVERHNGMLDINIENTTFSIMIMLEQEADI